MKKITTNATFKDCIASILRYHSYKNIDYIPYGYRTKLITMDSDNNKEEIMKMFEICVDFYIEENLIYFRVKKNDEELEEWFKDNQNSLNYYIQKLKNWFNKNEENKIQIENYLKVKKLDWILEKLI